MADRSQHPILRPNRDGTIDVSSPLTRGRAATVWFDADHQPHVIWAITAIYRNGLDEGTILTALGTAKSERVQ